VVLALSAISITVGYIGFRITYVLKKSSKQAMAKLKLQPGKTSKEFKALFVANFVMIPALTLFLYGAVLDEDLYRTIGRAGFVIFAIFVLGVKYSWWRRL